MLNETKNEKFGVIYLKKTNDFMIVYHLEFPWFYAYKEKFA